MKHQQGVEEQARQLAEQQKETGAETMSRVSGAIQGAVNEIENQVPRAAGYVRDAAGHLDRAAAELRERSVDDLLSGFSNFARAQPVAFFGGAVLAGLAISRFLKSSGDRQQGS